MAKVTWNTYESAATDLETVVFDSRVPLGVGESERGEHTLYSWLVGKYGEGAFDLFFTDKRTDGNEGLYANVEAAKVAYKKENRGKIKKWYLSEVEKHLERNLYFIDPLIMEGWETAPEDGQVWEKEPPEGIAHKHGIRNMAADDNFPINNFFQTVQSIVFPIPTQAQSGWIKTKEAFQKASEEIATGRRIENLRKNLEINKEYESMMGVKMAHAFIKAYTDDRSKHALLIKLINNEPTFRGITTDGDIVPNSPLLAYEAKHNQAHGELKDIRAYLDETNDPFLSEEAERGKKLISGDSKDEIRNRKDILESLATGALASGAEQRKEWFGLDNLSATPKSEGPRGQAYCNEWVNLREYLIDFCKSNRLKTEKQIEKKVEKIQENFAGGARTEQEIQDTLAKDTIKGLIEDNKERARFMEQCFLLHNILPLSKLSQQYSDRFKFLKVVDGGPDVVSRMHKRKGFEEMMNITQDKLALLQPSIQLYKRVYKGDNKVPEDSPFIFDDHTTQKSIESVLAEASGRVGSVGIQSLTVEYQGTDMESAKRILLVKLRLFVQNMSAFFADYADRAPYLDLIAPSKAFKGRGVKTKWLKDMFTGVHYHESQEYDPVHFEIKAVLGWSVPRSSSGFIGQDLRNALTQNKIEALLTLNDHTFNFNQDGTMTIDVDYHGRIEGLLEDDSRTSLFETREMREERQKHIDSFNEAVADVTHEINKSAIPEKQKYLKERYQQTHPDSSPDNLTAEELRDFENQLIEEGDTEFRHLRSGQKAGLDALVESKQKEIKEIKSKMLKLTHDSYKRMVETLELRGFSENRVGGVSYIQVNKEEMDFHTKAHGGAFGKFGDSLGSAKSVVAPPSPEGVDATSARSLSAAVEKETIEIEKAATQKDKSQSEMKESTRDSSPAPVLSSGNYEFGYFFLGDLIDVAMQMLNENGLNNKDSLFDIITGPLIFGTPEAKINLNIADIPVSISEFQHWFVENVIRKDKTNWTFADFLRAIATKIIFPALGGRCYEREAPMVSRDGNKLGMTILTYPSNPFKKMRNRVSINEVMDSIERISAKRTGRTNSSVHECILLHADFVPSTSKTGNIKEDLDAGIYHLVLGRDRGLVKEINFSKDALPFYKEDRMHMDGKIERISHPYVADVKMVGNTYFYPGCRVFVNPLLTTGQPANSKNSIVSKLGLGGYYVVLGVVLKIEGHSFETQLRTKWEANGWGTSKDAPRSLPTRLGEVVRLGDSDIDATTEQLSAKGETKTDMPPNIRNATEEEKEATRKIKQAKAQSDQWEANQREAVGTTFAHAAWNAYANTFSALSSGSENREIAKNFLDSIGTQGDNIKVTNIVKGADERVVVLYETEEGETKTFTVLKPESEE